MPSSCREIKFLTKEIKSICYLLVFSTHIPTQRNGTIKIWKGEADKQARWKMEIWQLFYIIQAKWVAPNWENKTRVSKEIEKGEEESEKQSRGYWNLILEDNTGRLESNWNNYWNIRSWFTGIAYWNRILRYWKTIRIYGTAWEDGNYSRGKLDLNFENLIGIVVITLEIAKGELLYGKNIWKNPEGWNKTYYY